MFLSTWKPQPLPISSVAPMLHFCRVAHSQRVQKASCPLSEATGAEKHFTALFASCATTNGIPLWGVGSADWSARCATMALCLFTGRLVDMCKLERGGVARWVILSTFREYTRVPLLFPARNLTKGSHLQFFFSARTLNGTYTCSGAILGKIEAIWTRSE